MAKVAAKNQAKRVDAQAVAVANAALEPWIEVHGGDARDDAPPSLVREAMRAWSLVLQIDALEDELKGIKAQLAQDIGAGHSLVVPAVCRVSVSATSSVSIADADKLRALLGDRWSDLVTEAVSYKPSEKLLDMAADGDDPMAPAYRALLRVRSSTTVRILAEK